MKCMNKDCSAEATHAVRLVVPDTNSDETSASGPMGIELCADHIREAETWDFGGMEMVLAAHVAKIAAPGTEPDIASAYVEAVPVTAAEHIAFMSAIGARP
jgi:hypothetical protein